MAPSRCTRPSWGNKSRACCWAVNGSVIVKLYESTFFCHSLKHFMSCYSLYWANRAERWQPTWDWLSNEWVMGLHTYRMMSVCLAFQKRLLRIKQFGVFPSCKHMLTSSSGPVYMSIICHKNIPECKTHPSSSRLGLSNIRISWNPSIYNRWYMMSALFLLYFCIVVTEMFPKNKASGTF